MPISKYDSQFGTKPGSASKALNAMKERYGEKKGTSVFYATKNKHLAERPSRSKRTYRRVGETE
jgi:hypothetical protein